MLPPAALDISLKSRHSSRTSERQRVLRMMYGTKRGLKRGGGLPTCDDLLFPDTVLVVDKAMPLDTVA